jgi:hypothetical protein
VLRGARRGGMRVAVPERSYHPTIVLVEAGRAFPNRGHDSSQRLDQLRHLGRARVESTLRDFFDRGAGPVQVVGALYVFEHYHRRWRIHFSMQRRA